MDELKTESRRIAASILFFAVTATAAIVLISAAFEKLFLLLVDKIAERMGA